MMSASGSHGHRALGTFLSLHIGIVDGIPAELFDGIDPRKFRRLDVEHAAEEADRLGQRGHRDHLHSIDYGGFTRITDGDYDSRLPAFFGGERHRQRPFCRSQSPIERQLPRSGIAAESVRFQLPAGHQQSNRNRKVHRSRIFGKIGRGVFPFGKPFFSGFSRLKKSLRGGEFLGPRA